LSPFPSPAGASAPFILANPAAGVLGHLSTTRDVPPQAGVLVVTALAGGMFGSWLGAQRLHPVALNRMLELVMLVGSTKLVEAAF
jgi:uncharacterized membrane protein YfcA